MRVRAGVGLAAQSGSVIAFSIAPSNSVQQNMHLAQGLQGVELLQIETSMFKKGKRLLSNVMYSILL